MLRVVVVVVILAHGLGHILFLVPLWSVAQANWGQSTQSWLLGSGSLVKLIGSLPWLVAVVGFAAVAIGLLSGQSWWRTVAVISAVVSLAGLALFWQSPASSSAVFAAAFDALVLVSLLLAHWPSVETVGA